MIALIINEIINKKKDNRINKQHIIIRNTNDYLNLSNFQLPITPFSFNDDVTVP